MADGALGPVWIGAVIAAAISSLVTALGWIVSHNRESAAERRRRRDKIVDMQKALRAEIAAYADQLREADLPSHLAAVLEAIDADPAHVPLVPRETHDTVFRALVADIHLLPSGAVDPVVRYYSHLIGVTSMADDLRGPTFRKLPSDRRARMYRHFIQMKVRAIERAEAADAALREGIARAENPDPWISTPEAGRCDPAPAAPSSPTSSPPP
jgi:hypothetical protein